MARLVKLQVLVQEFAGTAVSLKIVSAVCVPLARAVVGMKVIFAVVAVEVFVELAVTSLPSTNNFKLLNTTEVSRFWNSALIVAVGETFLAPLAGVSVFT